MGRFYNTGYEQISQFRIRAQNTWSSFFFSDLFVSAVFSSTSAVFLLILTNLSRRKIKTKVYNVYTIQSGEMCENMYLYSLHLSFPMKCYRPSWDLEVTTMLSTVFSNPESFFWWLQEDISTFSSCPKSPSSQHGLGGRTLSNL